MKFNLFWFCPIFAVMGCVADKNVYQTNKNLPQLRAELAQERAAWEALGIQDYQFTRKIPSGEGPGSKGYRVTVQSGIVLDVVKIETREIVDQLDRTIDDLFDYIGILFDADEEKEQYPGLIGRWYNIEYDPDYRFPAKIEIIRIYSEPTGGNGSKDLIEDFTIFANKNLPQLRAELAQERAAWEALGIQDYQFFYSVPNTFPRYEFMVTVKNGSFENSIVADSGVSTPLWGNFSIDGYFEKIAKVFDEDEKNPELIDRFYYVEYDPDYHFPVHFSYTSVYNESVSNDGSTEKINKFAFPDK